MPINDTQHHRMQRSLSCGALPITQRVDLPAANADIPVAGRNPDIFETHSPLRPNTRLPNNTHARNESHAPPAPEAPAQRPDAQAQLRETLAQMGATQAEMNGTLADMKTTLSDAHAQLADIRANSDQHAADFKQALDEKAKLSQQRYRESKGSWSKFVLKTCISGMIATAIRHLPLILSMAIPVLTFDVAATIAGGPIGLGAVMGVLVLVALGALLWQAYNAHREYRALKAQNQLDTATQSPDQPSAAAATTEGSGNTAGAPTPPAPQPARRSWYRHCVDFSHFFFKRGIR